jgi:hypothetical protein
MIGERFAQCVLAVLFLSAVYNSVAPAAEPNEASSRCFEIIAPQRHKQPDSPLLFNRCTGATWLLARTNKSNGRPRGYRWVALEIESPTPRDQAVRPVPSAAPPAKSVAPGERCFELAGRRFCE